MKRFILFILMICGSYAYAQNVENLDTLQQQIIEMQKAISAGGDLIETGGLLNNLGLGLSVCGGAVVGAMAIPYATRVNTTTSNYSKTNLILGVSIGGAMSLTGFILCIIGNIKISDGGTFLREIKLTGNGVSIPLSSKKQKHTEHIRPEP